MGVLIRCNDSDFSNYVGVAMYPMTETLKNLYYMGTDAEKTAKDESGNGNNGTIVGTVSYQDGYAEFSGTGTSNVMRAEDLPQTAAGVAGVALVKISGNRAVFSNGTSVNSGCLIMSPNRFVFGTDTSEALADIRYALPSGDGFYVLAWVLTTTGYGVYVMQNGSVVKLASGSVSGNAIKLYTGATANYKKLHIGGSSYNFAMDGTADIAAAGFYVGTPTESEIKDAMGYLKIYGEHVGLTVN